MHAMISTLSVVMASASVSSVTMTTDVTFVVGIIPVFVDFLGGSVV